MLIDDDLRNLEETKMGRQLNHRKENFILNTDLY